MKRRIVLSIALALSVVGLSLMSSDSMAQAQQRVRFRADTGAVRLGPNQGLRVTVAAPVDGADFLAVRFERFEYSQGVCNSEGLCKHMTLTKTGTGTLNLTAGEAASIVDYVDPDELLRVVVESNRSGARVTAQIIDVATNEVVAVVPLVPVGTD